MRTDIDLRWRWIPRVSKFLKAFVFVRRLPSQLISLGLGQPIGNRTPQRLITKGLPRILPVGNRESSALLSPFAGGWSVSFEVIWIGLDHVCQKHVKQGYILKETVVVDYCVWDSKVPRIGNWLSWMPRVLTLDSYPIGTKHKNPLLLSNTISSIFLLPTLTLFCSVILTWEYKMKYSWANNGM